MKKYKFKDGYEVEYFNPSFIETTVENDIHVRDIVGYDDEGDPIYGPWRIEHQERIITLCQTEVPSYTLDKEISSIYTNIGVAIRNPSDTNGELGKTISEGRSLKTPVHTISILSKKRLPKAIRDEQFVWAAKHIQRNLDGYVNRIREMLNE